MNCAVLQPLVRFSHESRVWKTSAFHTCRCTHNIRMLSLGALFHLCMHALVSENAPPLLERHCKKELQDPSSKSPPLCPPLACWTSHHLPARHPTICLLDITCDQFSRGLPLCVYKLCKPGRSGKGEVTFLLVRGQIVCLGLWAVLGGWLMSAELSAWAVPVSSFVRIVCNWAGL